MNETHSARPARTDVSRTESTLIISTPFQKNASTWPRTGLFLLGTGWWGIGLFDSSSTTAGGVQSAFAGVELMGTLFCGVIAAYLILGALTGRDVIRIDAGRVRLGTSMLGMGPLSGFRLGQIELIDVGKPGVDMDMESFDGDHIVLIETDRLRAMFGRKSGWNRDEAVWVCDCIRAWMERSSTTSPLT